MWPFTLKKTKTTFIPFKQGRFVTSPSGSQEKMSLNFDSNIFTILVLQVSPIEKGDGRSLEKNESPSSKYTLSQFT